MVCSGICMDTAGSMTPSSSGQSSYSLCTIYRQTNVFICCMFRSIISFGQLKISQVPTININDLRAVGARVIAAKLGQEEITRDSFWPSVYDTCISRRRDTSPSSSACWILKCHLISLFCRCPICSRTYL